MKFRALVVLSALSASFQQMAAQEVGRECVAPSGGYVHSLWLDSPVASGGPDSVGPERMRARLLGHYLLLEVVTEGAGAGKRVIESELAILPWPVYDTARHLGRPARMIAYGRSRTLREGHLPDSVQAVAGHTPERFFRITYRPPDALSLTAVQDSSHMHVIVFDAPGPILEVHEIEEGVLRGRWMDGGIAMLTLPTPVGLLMERGYGYFCAWRVVP